MKRKGFTLIELLAVIVVLAIILVIAVPKILEIIENADKRAYKESAELMAHAAKIQYQTKEVTGSAPVIPDEGIVYTFEEGVQTVSGNYDLLKFKGDKPYQGTITLTKDKKVIISDLISKNKKWCAKKEANEKQARVGRRTDPDFNCKIDGEDEVVVEDITPCLLEQDKNNENIYFIDSPSDLYAFSQSVNSGTDYSGKTVKVRNNLDMSAAKGECVTSFEPIGTEDNPFSGTFDGGAKIISNLEINKPNQDYVGLFGYIQYSLIKGFYINKFNIVGKDYVGGIAGISLDSEIKDIIIEEDNISGNNNIGGAVGEVGGNSYINNIIARNVEIIGNDGVSGIIGVNWNGATPQSSNIILEKAKIKGNQSVGVLTTRHMLENGFYSYDCIINDTYVTDGFLQEDLNDINFYEAAGLDTWIGGDNDSSDYYFDYNENNIVVLKNTKITPITFTLKGSGTKEDPYLINSTKEWKELSSKINLGYYYKLTTNLDFSNDNFYMLGSFFNNFIGTFDGGANEISNITINAEKVDRIGIIPYPYTNSNIYGFNLENINISGKERVGAVSGETINSTISEIALNNFKINGTLYVGGIAGFINGYCYVNESLIKSGEIKGTSTVGGIVGVNWNGAGASTNGILENVYIEGTDTVSIITNRHAFNNVYYSNNNYINNLQQTDGFDSTLVNNLEYYAGVLETLYTGDKNNTGYFFDYISDKKGIYLVPAKEYVFSGPSSDDEEDTNTDGGGEPTEGNNCYITISCSGIGDYRKCSINYYENGILEDPYKNKVVLNLTKGSSCAVYSSNNSTGGFTFYVSKKPSVTETCSVTFRANSSEDCLATTYKTISF